jgi:hypothetical protein
MILPSPGSVIDVWYTTANIGGVDYNPLDSIFLSDWDFSMGIKRAIEIWNEQGGSKIKLRYRGSTSSTSITGAIMLSGDSAMNINGPLNCQASGSHAAAETIYTKN